MDFSEKIAMLRRQKNWSQEELAEKLMVTRQAVSKWESAQSMPDLDKIVQLSELLGVSTDYLLKSDRDAPEAETPQRTQEKASARRVTREEVSRFLSLQESTAPKISLGVALCVWSPIVLIGLTALGSVFHVKIPDSVAGGLGLCVLLGMVAAAVALFLTSGTKLKEFEYLEREPIAPDADARELARKQEAVQAEVCSKLTTAGVVLCILSAVPIFAVMCVGRTRDGYDSLAVCALLLLVGIACLLLVRILLGNIITGQISALFYSLSGGLAAYLLMLLLRRSLRGSLLWVQSVFCAIAHNLGQLTAAAIITKTPAIWYYLPVLTLAAIISGALTGLCAQLILSRLRKTRLLPEEEKEESNG